ncbi:transcriptional regulator [Arthrobacter agilis]|uniref:Transcriptional regulator n=1 Tax=Arthrobacter agilis TaxID=37921 RepID=A0A2L0UHS0_9MICC|nr:RNA-binding domain-containing protein [Arthrobacter agilis]AUZ88804.1 transcriptional regulator [Arthrobacter agilis]
MDQYLAALEQIEQNKKNAAALESERLDFKQEKKEKKETFQDIAEAAVCFANASGGEVVLGVADRGTGVEAFLGTDIPAELLKERIYTLTEPNLLVEVREVTRASSRLLVIFVPAGVDVYQTKKTSPTHRLKDMCLVMTPAETSRLHDERRGIDWSAQSSGRDIGEIDRAAAFKLRDLLSRVTNPAVQELATADTESLLVALRLLRTDDTLTNAGELLLCQPIGSQARNLLVYQHRATSGGEADFVRRWGAPVVSAIPDVMEVIANRIGITPVSTASGQQIQIEDYPLSAIREALANALMHGDFREDRPVSVEHSPETLLVRSPGPLVSGVMPSNILTHPSKPRFPHLAEVFRTLGLAEQLGQGVDRMFRDMIRSGRSAPTISEVGDQVRDTLVTFTGGPPNSRVARFLSTLPTHEQNDTDTLLVTTVLCDRKTITAAGIAPIIQRQIEASEAILRRLATGEAHLLEPSAGTAGRRHPNYRLQRDALIALGPAVRYQKRSVSESDAKVQEHIVDYGIINSRTIQRLFDIDVYQARDMLRDLLGREILVRVSEQTRGTAVKYGPGPKFPIKKYARSAPVEDEGTLLF